jgi:hypothetical protein
MMWCIPGGGRVRRIAANARIRMFLHALSVRGSVFLPGGTTVAEGIAGVAHVF